MTIQQSSTELQVLKNKPLYLSVRKIYDKTLGLHFVTVCVREKLAQLADSKCQQKGQHVDTVADSWSWSMIFQYFKLRSFP